MGQAKPQATPSVYGRYETLFRIAAGGMAEVYAARVRGEAGFQKLVALKRMLPHLTDDERFVTMFMDEGKLAANISSPNVVSTLDLGRADDGSLYLVMELVVGTTLSNLLRTAARDAQPLPVDVAVELIAQAAQGLHDAHEARTPFGAPLHIVHRDVSPQNILVGTDGRVRITDFGVARAIMRRTKTSTGEFKGKLSYFSPEQCADKNLDRRSDVFSLGVVAWETLTTRRLFHAENPLAVLERVTRMEIPLAHAVNPSVPPAVSAVVAMALERDRDRRFASAADFAQSLRSAARDTVGLSERERVARLVATHGGDSVSRIERQIKESLSAAPAALPMGSPLDDAKTEISSGIVFRSDDGGIAPATPPAVPMQSGAAMISSTGASFVGMPVELSQAAPVVEKPASKLPYVIAAVVAAAGLAVGAVIGVQAVMTDEREEPSDVRVLPPAAGEGPAGAAPSTIDPPAPQEEVAPPSDPAPPAADDPAPEETHRPRRRGRHERPPRAEVPVPTPRPLVAPTPPAPAPTPPPPRPAPEPRAVSRPAPAPAPAPQPASRPRGLVGVDGFDRDVSR